MYWRIESSEPTMDNMWIIDVSKIFQAWQIWTTSFITNNCFPREPSHPLFLKLSLLCLNQVVVLLYKSIFFKYQGHNCFIQMLNTFCSKFQAPRWSRWNKTFQVIAEKASMQTVGCRRMKWSNMSFSMASSRIYLVGKLSLFTQV